MIWVTLEGGDSMAGIKIKGQCAGERLAMVALGIQSSSSPDAGLKRRLQAIRHVIETGEPDYELSSSYNNGYAKCVPPREK